jgi:NADH:ubiquinone reductase (H+-translocating)
VPIAAQLSGTSSLFGYGAPAMKFDIVIAGGGFAGAYCARVLARELGRAEGEKRVALIAERNVFVFQPMLAEVAGASLAPADVVNPLRHFCRGVVVLQGAIQSVDWARRELVLDGGRFTRNHTVAFEHLVLALGSVSDLSIVPGMAEYGWPMRTVTDALRLRAAVINRMEEANLVADPVVKARLLTFVVVGGGYTGVETAGQLHDLVHEAKKFYVNLRDTRERVVLVHSREQLLLEIGPKLGAYAQRVLQDRHIEVRLNTRVVEVTATNVVLSDGNAIPASTVVSTIGNAPNPIVLGVCRQAGVAYERGRVSTEPTMRVPGQTHLWAIGDCAAVPWSDGGETKVAPPTAQFAQRQGEQLGRNLARLLRGQELRPFRHHYLGQLATIGERHAVAEVMGFYFRGFIAWWMWRTIYLAKLPGLARKLRVMMDWTFDIFFEKDISVLLPAPEEVLRPIHLETGELLFENGAPCRAFFFVRKGQVRIETEAGAQLFPVGSVIDQQVLDANSCWRGTATAAESSDLIAFRGRAFELLRTQLRLVPISGEAQLHEAPATK